MRRFSAETPPPYTVAYTDAAEAEFDAAYTYFASRNQPAAECWLSQETDALAHRAADHAALSGQRYLAGDMTNFRTAPLAWSGLVRGASYMNSWMTTEMV